MVFNWFQWYPIKKEQHYLESPIYGSHKNIYLLSNGWYFRIETKMKYFLNEDFTRRKEPTPDVYLFVFKNQIRWCLKYPIKIHVFESYGFWWCLEQIWDIAINEMNSEKTKSKPEGY